MSSLELSGDLAGFIRQTLMRGCDDFVMAAEIVDNIFNLEPLFRGEVSPQLLTEIAKAEESGGQIEFALARRLNDAIVRAVLSEGYMMIGDLYHGFHPWQLTLDEALKKVSDEWDELNGVLPDPGIYWLSNTERGEVIGQEALKRWQEDRKLKK